MLRWSESKKLRSVLMILPRMEMGGGEVLALQVIRGLLQWGVEVDLLVVIAGGPMEREIPSGVRVHCVLRSPKSGSLQNPLCLVTAVVSQLPKLFGLAHRHNLILALGEFGGSLYLGIILSLIARRPLVGWALGEVFKMTSIENTVKWRGVIHRRLLRHCYPLACRILAVSHKTENDLVVHIPNIKDKVRVVYGPVPVSEVLRLAEEPLPPEFEPWFDLPVVVGFGRHEWRKGFDILIRAHAVLKRRGVEHRLLIIGPEGPTTESLQALVRELEVEDSVKLSGYLPNPFPLIKASSVFAFPSRSEGLGIALVEAMALGKPVVVSEASGGAVDVVDGGRYGLLVAPEDSAALAGALERLLRSSHEQAYWGQRAFERSRFFTPDTFMERLMAVLEEACDEFR